MTGSKEKAFFYGLRGFCPMVEYHWVGSATNGATHLAYKSLLLRNTKILKPPACKLPNAIPPTSKINLLRKMSITFEPEM